MVSVKVVSQSSGKAVQGQRVAVGFDGVFRGMSSTEYTDSTGEAHFDCDPGNGSVYVNGYTKHKGHISGKVVVYI